MNKELSTQQALRYSRQINLPSFDLDKQEILLNSSVLQIGVGGLGSASAQYLVASGLGKITLVDNDTVEITNLQRQVLHQEDDLGSSKVDSAQRSLEKINSDCRVEVIDRRLGYQELREQVKKHHIVLDCSDNLLTRNLVNKVCFEIDTPLVSGAAIRMEGQIACFFPSSGKACYQCLSSYFPEQNLSCMEAGIMSPVVGIIGNMQALEAIKILTGYGQALIGKLLIFDAMGSQWQEFTVPKKVDCPVCQNK